MLALAEHFANKHHCLYLGRGAMLPVAMEGALKLKEISYIHAEAYPLLENLKPNLHEVRARGGELYVFADSETDMGEASGIHVINIAPVDDCIAPVIYTVPLQLFAYHVAVMKGADVDQPRNLAKSVTVE